MSVNPIYARRRRTDIFVRLLCVGAALFGVTWLALILFTLLYNGITGLSLQVFTESTPPPGSTTGGLLNAITGSVIMTVIGVGIGISDRKVAGNFIHFGLCLGGCNSWIQSPKGASPDGDASIAE